jgi:hypothetical protein
MATEMTLNIRHHSLPFDSQRPEPQIQQLELLAESLALGPTTDGKVAASTTRGEVRETQKAERLGATQPISTTATSSIAAKTKHAGLAGLNLQVESREAFLQSRKEALRIRLVLEARQEIVGKAHKVRLASTRLREALLKPEIQHVMEVDV